MQPPEQIEQQPEYDPFSEIVADDMQRGQHYPQVDSDVMVLGFMLKMEIPKKYHAEFDRYMPVLGRRLALSNIKREEVKHVRICFSLIADYYRINQPHVAREVMRDLLVFLLASSSVNGFQVRQTNTRRSEYSIDGQKRRGPVDEEKKKRRWGFFGGKKEE